MSNESILGVLPVRAGSKGVPGKNSALIAGRPALVWAAEALVGSSISEAICSTDSPKMAEIAEKAGLRVPFIRPAELATDKATSASVVIHALEEMEKLGQQFSHVVLVQATNPTVTINDVEKAVSLLRRPGVDSVMTVQRVPFEFHPAVTMLRDEGFNTSWVLGENMANRPRQSFPEAYSRVGLVYGTSVRLLRETRSFWSGSVHSIEIEPERAIGIDVAADLERAEKFLAKRRNERSNLGR